MHIESLINPRKYEEIRHEQTGRNSMAVKIRRSIKTIKNPKPFRIGDCHDQDKRNSVAVIPKCSHQQTSSLSKTRRTTMQTEIEILETRENPAIVWY